MEKKRILYISQEINPYLQNTEIANIARSLPQSMNENGYEVRVFMPRFGLINERRHQLHEVIRLSGMNLIVNDMDQPLIIKVASIPQARIQVYFIDNEEYFKRKGQFADKSGKVFPDNDERSIFFSRGVLETVKKLGWTPDIIHCHGWMTSLVPLYLRNYYHEEPTFAEAKVVYSVYEKGFDGSLNAELAKKIAFDGINGSSTELIKDPTFLQMNKLGIENADAVVFAEESADLKKFAEDKGLSVMDHPGEDYIDAYLKFYSELLVEETVA
jgi:starch synthase